MPRPVAVRLGLSDLGENRAQELLAKAPVLAALGAASPFGVRSLPTLAARGPFGANRGGVPVFNLPNSSPSSFSDPDKPIAAASPALPPAC